MNLKNIEMYKTPDGKVMIFSEGQGHREYVQGDTVFTNEMINYIKEFYTDAFSALCREYAKSSRNKSYYEYVMVHRFIRCNFGEYDEMPDIDEHSGLNFECVSCPLKGECKYDGVICNPTFNSHLTDREKQVMKLIYKRKDVEEISEILCISPLTVKQHIRHSLSKTRCKSRKDFISYANETRMFKNR